jgi:hypothetical protein
MRSFPQGMLVALVTGMGSKLQELGNTLSLEQGELYVFLLYLDSYTVTLLSLHMVKLLLPPTIKLLIQFLNSSAWTSLAVTVVTLKTIVTISLLSLHSFLTLVTIVTLSHCPTH